MSLEQAIANMRGGCAYNFDGTKREPGDYTDIEANVKRWKEKYGTDIPENILEHWKTN